MKSLILFSGTNSIEKTLERLGQKDYRGLDIELKFNPYYHEDILTWDYKKAIEEYGIPDYIHASPVCAEFSNIKNATGSVRDMRRGCFLVEKALEIIEYVKVLNPKLIFTLENPRGLMRTLPIMKKYDMLETSYCQYGFSYNKPTNFWYGGFNLELKKPCGRKQDKSNWCPERMRCRGIHGVRLGFSGKMVNGIKVIIPNQIIGYKHFSHLKKESPLLYKKYTPRDFRYRIPQSLCNSIIEQVLKQKNINDEPTYEYIENPTGNKV